MKARKHLIAFAAAAIAVAPLASARADNMAPNTKTSGVIESVNVPRQEIVIAEKAGGESTKSLASATIVDTGRKALAIQDLKPGDTVAVASDANGAVTEVAVVQPAPSAQPAQPVEK